EGEVPAPFTAAEPEPVFDAPVVPGPLAEPELPRYTPVYVSGESRPGKVEPAVSPSSPAWMSPTAKPTWHTVDGPHP
ncbi:hypothetical protein C0063_18125, partial [Pseudoxanthomonas sp. KAs_5_3]